ncbi:TPA: type IV secretion system protein [Klebsiella pneumoniae]|uniref:type IV secretion system protein n=1 Tax=Enterobacter kobei TaxID=208224 RepID=UPI00214A6966|nr:type IV secretion system protein [Enterobacter kobei]MCR2799254.1 type IV secretion system protein [Enterobacter kobei]HBU6357857.1 type IV secretion system protein [Klebsiella pneumoniae]HBV8808885.1 type IV secretion system protein [Klebsiella pneumoniae]
MDADFFQVMDKFIMAALKTATQGKMAFYGSLVSTLFTSAFTLYLLVNAYQIVAGKYQKPLEDLTYNIAKMALITLFITNAGGWLDMSIAAIEGLKEGLAGGDPWLFLDQLWIKIQQVAAKLLQLDTSTYVKMAGGIGALLTLIGGGFVLVVTALVYLAAEYTILLLCVTAPVFIFCLMFGFLRQMFNNWLQAIFSSILTVMFASIVMMGAIRFINKIFSQMVQQAEFSNLMTMGLMAGVAGVISGVLVVLSSKAAGQIAGVSVNAAVQGMAMVGLGLGAGVAAKAAMGATRSVAGGAKGAGHGLFEGGAGRKLDEKKSRGASAMIGYGAARGTRAVVQKIQQRRARKKEKAA